MERLWLLSKRIFRRRFLDAKVKKFKWGQVQKIVEESINQVPSLPLKRHVERCLTRMQEFIKLKNSANDALDAKP